MPSNVHREMICSIPGHISGIPWVNVLPIRSRHTGGSSFANGKPREIFRWDGFEFRRCNAWFLYGFRLNVCSMPSVIPCTATYLRGGAARGGDQICKYTSQPYTSPCHWWDLITSKYHEIRSTKYRLVSISMLPACPEYWIHRFRSVPWHCRVTG